MILIFQKIGNKIPMVIINARTGTPLHNIAYEGNLDSLEYMEHLNENLIIK